MNLHDSRRGLTATRFLKSLAIAKGDPVAAHGYACGQNWRDTPIVEKALVDAIDQNSGSALLAQAGFDFAEFLRPQTILGRLAGLRRVPFNVRMLAQTGGTAAHWVGETHPKPLSAASFEGETLPLAKVCAICVITGELLRSSAPSAESVLSADLGRAGAQAMDEAFIDPANAGISDVKPASVTSGVTPIASTGSMVANIDNDLDALLNALSAAGSDLGAAVWVMRPRTAIYLARLRAPGGDGALAYPGMSARGGVLMGLPVITSANVPVSSTSGNPTSITLLDPSQIALADEGEAELGVALHASVQMEDAPQTGAQSQVSLWQRGLAALRAERTINWRARRAGMAQVLSGVTY